MSFPRLRAELNWTACRKHNTLSTTCTYVCTMHLCTCIIFFILYTYGVHSIHHTTLVYMVYRMWCIFYTPYNMKECTTVHKIFRTTVLQCPPILARAGKPPLLLFILFLLGRLVASFSKTILQSNSDFQKFAKLIPQLRSSISTIFCFSDAKESLFSTFHFFTLPTLSFALHFRSLKTQFLLQSHPHTP